MSDWTALQSRLGITFSDVHLLQQAFVHRSYLNENPEFKLGSNERLEFLGDALLSLVIAEFLFREFPDFSEGELTKLRSDLVRQDSLARLASSLGLGDYLYLGQGEEKGGGRKRARNMACTFEALVGAAFVDQGFEASRDLILRLFSPAIREARQRGQASDCKSRLQEIIQAERQERPVYRLVEAVGPDHDKTFWVEVMVGGEILARGSGKSKQAAEKDAARQALEKRG
ncbi:MAG: ribonuclease III [Dehalococcoidia bacterium]|nr:ribonuclease III [Dehalococcoidia bacterium]